MKVEQLKRAYRELSLICYRDKFIIPQKPYPPLNSHLSYTNLIRKKMQEEKNIPKYTSKEIHERVKMNIANQDAQYLKAKSQYEKLLAEYQERMRRYTEEYINPPLLFTRTKGVCYYIRQQFEKNKNLNLNFSAISQRYASLDEQQKKKIQEKCEQERLKLLPKYNEYIANHLIPKHKGKNVTSAYHQFLAENFSSVNEGDDKKATREITKLFSALTPQEKQKLNLIAANKNRQAKQKYEQFLKKWDITQEQLAYIVDVSAQYNKIKAAKTLKSKDMKLIQQVLEAANSDTETVDQTQQ